MSKLGMDQLLNRVIKLEEAITKLAAWTHFSEPLDLGRNKSHRQFMGFLDCL